MASRAGLGTMLAILYFDSLCFAADVHFYVYIPRNCSLDIIFG